MGQLDQLAHLHKRSIVVSFGLELVASAGWWDIGWRVWQEVGQDRVLLTAADAAFYLLLAPFPALAAFVSLYGFVADPATVADHVSYLGGLLPSAGIDIIRNQLEALASQDQQALGIGFLIGLAIALLPNDLQMHMASQRRRRRLSSRMSGRGLRMRRPRRGNQPQRFRQVQGAEHA